MLARIEVKSAQPKAPGGFTFQQHPYVYSLITNPWLQGAKEATTLWVLKADVHRGQGLHFAPALEAARHARLPGKGGDAQWVVSQRFVANQYLVADRPFYLRCLPAGP